MMMVVNRTHGGHLTIRPDRIFISPDYGDPKESGVYIATSDWLPPLGTPPTAGVM